MEESPDSALSILRGVDTTRIYDRKIRHRFYLLRGQATARSGESVVPLAASLKDAAEFYKFSPDKRSDMLAQYYYGCVIEGGPDAFTEALYRHIRAKALAEELRDTLYMAATASSLYNVYASAGYYSDALAQARSSHRLFQALPGYETAAASASLDILSAYYGLEEYDTIMQSLPPLEGYIKSLGNQELELKGKVIKAHVLHARHKYIEALPIFQELDSHPAYAGEYKVLMASGLIERGDYQKAKDLLDSIPVGQHEESKAGAYSYLYEKMGDYKKAFDYSSDFYKAWNRVQNSNARKGYATILHDYIHEEQARHSETKRNDNLHLMIIVGVAIIFGALLLWWSLYSRKERKIEVEKHKDSINTLSSKLEQVSSKYDSTSRELIKKEFGLANDYFQELYACGDSDSAKLKVSRRLASKLVDKAAGKIDRDKLIDLLNSHSDNLYSKFEQEMPGLKKEDYLLFLLSALGFTNASIAVIIGTDDITTIYSRRKRLRKRIKDTVPAHADIFMEALNSSTS